MTIRDIIGARDNVGINDLVTVVRKNIDIASGECIKKEITENLKLN